MHFKSQEKRRAQTSNLINTSFSSVLLYFNFTSTVPLLLFPTFFSCKCHTSENTQGSFLHILTTDEIQADVNTAWGVPECDRAAERHSPSFCLPPSRGAITADTESTISALTEPPPTHASTQNVTHLDNWKVCPPPPPQTPCRSRRCGWCVLCKPTMWRPPPPPSPYRQSSRAQTSNRRKVWILWRASICKWKVFTVSWFHVKYVIICVKRLGLKRLI